MTAITTPFFRLLALATLLGMFLLPGPTARAQEELVVRIRPFREKNIDYTKEYKIQLLDLILARTEDTDGPYRIEISGEDPIPQSRVLELVEAGDLTVIATMTSAEREKMLLPVRIPVFRGLFGYRIFIVRRADLERFASIRNEEELKAMWAGQGHDWPDTRILQANGYNVTTGADYRGLFGMLETGRFDYFPRGANEPWREVEEEQARDIVVEPTLMLHYYAPSYFFVSRSNPELADRIQRGFEIILRDGSFDELFNSHWYIQDTLEKSRMNERRMFHLDNPLLTPETPLDRPELWYHPGTPHEEGDMENS